MYVCGGLYVTNYSFRTQVLAFAAPVLGCIDRCVVKETFADLLTN